LSTSGPSDTGFRVIDVWESEEAFARFGETLGPIMQQLGLDATPKVYPVHNFVAASG
jgi:hypothetical protein